MSAIAVATPSSLRSRTIDWGRFALVGFATIAVAVVANVLIYLAGGLLVGYDPGFVVLASVAGTVLFTVVPAIVAVLLYALFLRFAGDPARIFTRVAAVILVLSVIPDFTYIPSVPGASAGQTAILVLMHIVAAVVIVAMLTNFTPAVTRGRSS